MIPLSIRPVTTVPRPSIEKMSSIGIRNGLSTSRTGVGMYVSRAFINSSIFFDHSTSPFKALLAEPRITGTPFPSKLFFVKSSRTSSSTRSRRSFS